MDQLVNFLATLDWVSFLVAMILIELTPGPNMGWLAALSAQAGRKAGFRAVTGIATGLSLQVLAAATGLAAIAAASPALYQTLRWAGVLFMLYLAWNAWTESGENSPAVSKGEASFRHGLIANVLNPKALVFYVAVVGQFTTSGTLPVWLQILVLGALHVLIATAVHAVIVLLGARLGDTIEYWRRRFSVRLGFSLALVAVAVWVAWSTR